MSKKARRIIIMTAALAALLLIYVGINKMIEKKAREETKAEEESKITVTNIDTDSIIGFSYDYNGENYSFTKKDETWYFDQDKNVNLAQADIKTMLSSVAELKADRLIAETDENFADYGLDKPSQTIKIKEAGEDSTVIHVGSVNSITGSYYVTIDGTKTVYAVDSTVATAFQKTLEDLTEAEETTDEAEQENIEKEETTREDSTLK